MLFRFHSRILISETLRFFIASGMHIFQLNNMKRASHGIRKVPNKSSIRRLIRQLRTLIISLVFLAALMIIYADTIIANLSLQSYQETERVKTTQPRPDSAQSGPESPTTPLLPPPNSTREARIAWLQEKLPEFDVFHTGQRAERFNSRVAEFFQAEECRDHRFFMTWLLPAGQFGQREFLSIDSLFSAHPYGCLVIISGSMDSAHGLRTLKPVIEKGFRVLAVTPNLQVLVDNTPARAWLEEMKAGKRDPGSISLGQNLSNLIRLAFLYKYGGVYMDTDFLVLKKFDGLRNTIGAQSSETLNNAVLVFDPNHPVVHKFIEEFATTFNGNKWGFNGPYLVTRVVKRLGPGRGVGGGNFTVLPPEGFYPVDWVGIRRLFRRPGSEREARWVEDEVERLSRVAYGIHLWNKKSRRLRIEEGSVLARLVMGHCVICQSISSS